MSDRVLNAMRDAIQTDPGGRGLATDPRDNLCTACPGDFAAACRSIADTPNAAVAVVTGFLILNADPPAGETDGPLGALFLARALTAAGVRVALLTDFHSKAALAEGLAECGLMEHVWLGTLPPASHPWNAWLAMDWRGFKASAIQPTHLVALERPGPGADGRCRNMRGRDITEYTAPAHLLFENDPRAGLVTIGIGDGGNEIGMGKIAPAVIARNVPNGDAIACRVPTDHLIVCGVSNWGAYALAAGVRHLRGVPHDPALFDPARERALLELMVERGGLVDGPTGQRQATVDGLTWEEYVKPLVQLGAVCVRPTV